jgi:hypothetical protein
MIPNLSGTLVSNLGVQPVSAGFEAVTLVEYDRFTQLPRPRRRPENKLLLRAEVIEETAVSRRVLHLLGRARDQPEVSTKDLQEKLSSYLSKIDKDSPLAEALNAYKRSLVRNMEDRRLYRLVSTHLTVPPGMRSDAVRRRQAEYILKQLKERTGLDDDVPEGAAKDAYEALIRQLPPASSSSPPGASSSSPPAAAPSPSAHHAGPEPADVTEDTHSKAATSARDADGKGPSDVHYINSGPDQAVQTDMDAPSVIPDLFHICAELVLKSQDLLEAICELISSNSPDELGISIPPCRSRAAEVADLLRELDNHVVGRTDFEWNNALGSAKRNLGQLRRNLPLSSPGGSRSTGRLNRSSLRIAALNLNKATVQLEKLVP